MAEAKDFRWTVAPLPNIGHGHGRNQLAIKCPKRTFVLIFPRRWWRWHSLKSPCYNRLTRNTCCLLRRSLLMKLQNGLLKTLELLLLHFHHFYHVLTYFYQCMSGIRNGLGNNRWPVTDWWRSHRIASCNWRACAH